MLEPIAPPRVGQALNLLGALAAGLATLAAATITSVSGTVPVIMLAPLVAVGFLVRFGGVTYAAAQGRWTMPWFPRALSWVAFGSAFVILGLQGAVMSVAAFGAFVAADAACGFVKRDAPPRHARKARRAVKLRRVMLGLLLVAYLGLVVTYHLTFARYLSVGPLITWTLLSLAFCVVLMTAIKGPRAGEAWLAPPRGHRVHERREAFVADPQREHAESVLLKFRARGDAGPFLDLVRQACRDADLPDGDTAALEERLLVRFARAGTQRDEDIRSALDEVERHLSLRIARQEARS